MLNGAVVIVSAPVMTIVPNVSGVGVGVTSGVGVGVDVGVDVGVGVDVDAGVEIGVAVDVDVRATAGVCVASSVALGFEHARNAKPHTIKAKSVILKIILFTSFICSPATGCGLRAFSVMMFSPG